ncbi:MAG: peptidyl-prolyl cis-trans isomerase [Syntrophomonadaceae bacterium]
MNLLKISILSTLIFSNNALWAQEKNAVLYTGKTSLEMTSRSIAAGDSSVAVNPFGEKVKENKVVLSVDDLSVGMEEFSERLNFSPALREFSGEMERKQDLAASIIAGKILSGYAEMKGFDTVQNVKRTISQYEKEAVYEDWMQKEITDKVQVSTQELIEAYPRFAEQRIVDYLVFPDGKSAREASREIKKGKKLDSFKTKDGKPVLQTKEIDFGEALPKVEELIYSMKKGEVSGIVPLDGKYYIFNLKKTVPHPQHSTQSLGYWKPSLEKILRERKTTSEFKKVMPLLMQDRKFTINKKLYQYVLNALEGKLTFDDKSKLPEVLNQEMADMPGDFSQNLSEPFMKFQDGTLWTVGDFWQKLRFGPYLLNYRSKKEFTDDFSYLIRTVVITETVMSDGYKKGYNNSAYVKEQTRMWKDDLLAKIYLHELGRETKISEDEMKNYYSGNPSTFRLPDMCRIREILVSDEKLAESLVKRINAGGDWTNLAKQYSSQSPDGSDSEKGIYIARDTWGKIGETAFSLKPGEVYGPIKTEDNKFAVIKLLGYEIGKIKTFDEVRSDVHTQILNDKLRTQIQQILGESVSKHSIYISKDNLNKVALIGASMLVRKSHFPNRSAVPLALDVSHEDKWFRELWNRQQSQ